MKHLGQIRAWSKDGKDYCSFHCPWEDGSGRNYNEFTYGGIKWPDKLKDTMQFTLKSSLYDMAPLLKHMWRGGYMFEEHVLMARMKQYNDQLRIEMHGDPRTTNSLQTIDTFRKYYM